LAIPGLVYIQEMSSVIRVPLSPEELIAKIKSDLAFFTQPDAAVDQAQTEWSHLGKVFFYGYKGVSAYT